MTKNRNAEHENTSGYQAFCQKTESLLVEKPTVDLVFHISDFMTDL